MQYRSALGHLPRRKREPPREPIEPMEPSDSDAADPPSEARPATPKPENEESPEIVKARAVLNANVAACYVQLVGRLFEVARSCSRHLLRHRGNIRKLSKRARKVEDH